jgi:hypothetical protein
LLAKLAKEKKKSSPAPVDATTPAETDDVKMADVKEEGEQEESETPPPPDAKVEANGAVNGDTAMLEAVAAEVSLASSTNVRAHPRNGFLRTDSARPTALASWSRSSNCGHRRADA